MQIDRLFGIVYYLMDKKTATSKELAAHFEVSVRTILRDIDTLSAAGVPIYTTQGRGGGVSLMDGYTLSKAVVTEEEQAQILFALQSLSATQHLGVKDLLVKLRGLFPSAGHSWIEVDFSRWGSTPAEQGKFDLLRRAILEKRALSFLYSSSYGKTGPRKVYPLKLVFKGVAWYLQAAQPGEEYRTFKVARMRRIAVLDESFEGMRFQPPGLESLGGRPSPCLMDVTLKFSPRMAYRAYDEFGEEAVAEHPDGSLTVRARLPVDHWLSGYLLSFGTEAEVLHPASLRRELARRAEKIMIHYQK